MEEYEDNHITDYGLGAIGYYIDILPDGLEYRMFDKPNEVKNIINKWTNQYTMGLVRFDNKIQVLLKSSGPLDTEDVVMIEFNIIKNLIETDQSKVIFDNEYYVDKP